MKKFYLLIILGLISATGFAQQRIAKAAEPITLKSMQNLSKQQSVQPRRAIDTLTNHWDVIFPIPVDTPVCLGAAGGGFIDGL